MKISERNLFERIEKQKKEIEVYTYLMYDGNFYKIGKSKDPEKRLRQIKTGNPACELICFSNRITELELHVLYANSNVGREWFDFKEKPDELNEVIHLINNGRRRKTKKKKESEKSGYRKMQFIGQGKQKKGSYHAATSDKVLISFRKTKADKRNSQREKKYNEEKKLYDEYVINFGKFINIKLVDMINEEQRDYLSWIIGEKIKRGEDNTFQYRAFKWQLEK
jgi:hypothetical protein